MKGHRFKSCKEILKRSFDTGIDSYRGLLAKKIRPNVHHQALWPVDMPVCSILHSNNNQLKVEECGLHNAEHMLKKTEFTMYDEKVHKGSRPVINGVYIDNYEQTELELANIRGHIKESTRFINKKKAVEELAKECAKELAARPQGFSTGGKIYSPGFFSKSRFLQLIPRSDCNLQSQAFRRMQILPTAEQSQELSLVVPHRYECCRKKGKLSIVWNLMLIRRRRWTW